MVSKGFQISLECVKSFLIGIFGGLIADQLIKRLIMAHGSHRSWLVVVLGRVAAAAPRQAAAVAPTALRDAATAAQGAKGLTPKIARSDARVGTKESLSENVKQPW